MERINGYNFQSFKDRDITFGMLVVPEQLLRHGKFEPPWDLAPIFREFLKFSTPFTKMQDSLSVFKIGTCKGCHLVATEKPLKHGKFEPRGTLH